VPWIAYIIYFTQSIAVTVYPIAVYSCRHYNIRSLLPSRSPFIDAVLFLFTLLSLSPSHQNCRYLSLSASNAVAVPSIVVTLSYCRYLLLSPFIVVAIYRCCLNYRCSHLSLSPSIVVTFYYFHLMSLSTGSHSIVVVIYHCRYLSLLPYNVVTVYLFRF